MRNNSFAEKRKSAIKDDERAFYEELLMVLNDARQLNKEGKSEEFDSLIDGMRSKIEDMIVEEEQYIVGDSHDEVDRGNIPDSGVILADNDMIVLKMICENEYDSYMDVSYDCSFLKSVFKDEQYKKELWEQFLKDYTLVASIYDKKSGDFIGYCSIKDIRSKYWEIAIEERINYRNQGYGFSALSLFVTRLTELVGHRIYRVRIDIDNYASQRLFKKLGGSPNGISEFWLHGNRLIEFQNENEKFIDVNIKRIADEFGVEAKELLGHVLEYQIDSKRMLCK